jgi:Flp pilus assembly pilin Flp
MLRLRQSLAHFLRDEDGQSITEYGAVIAFVGVMIAICFGMARGGLFGALSDSFSAVTSGMGEMNAYATGATT